MFNQKLPANLFCLPLLLGGCARVNSCAPSLDVYGSYFPAWLICLMAGLILTILVSLVGRVFDLGTRILGPLVPISLILIFSITSWFLFLPPNTKLMIISPTTRDPEFEIKARAHPVSKKSKPLLGLTIGVGILVLAFILSLAAWNFNEQHPRTDDAVARANVIGIAPASPGHS